MPNTDAGQNSSKPNFQIYPDATGQYAKEPWYNKAFIGFKEGQHAVQKVDDSGQANKQLNQYANQFSNLFTNSVGRAPTSDEIGQFFDSEISQHPWEYQDGNSDHAKGFRDTALQFLNDNFQQTAQQTAGQRLSDLGAEGQSLADQFQAMGQTSLKGLADDLQGYQVRLFEKLRPQLNLSAQAGGFQDSGGQTLQEQGALRDLGTTAMGYLLPLKNQLDTQANALRYGAASAPYSLATGFAAGQPGVLANAGTSALSQNRDYFNSLVNFQRQVGLTNLENQAREDLLHPGMLSNLGNSFATSFGKSSGEAATKFGQGGLGDLGSFLKGPPGAMPPVGG